MANEYLDKNGLQLYHNKVKQEIAGVKSQLEDNALNSIEVDASLTKLNSVVDGNVIIDKIQGRTLLNLSEKQDEVKTVSVHYAQFFNICELSRLELNTDYTLIITVKNTFSSSKGYHGYIGAGKIDSYAYDLTPGNGLSFISSNTGVTATKFKITQQELDKGGTHLAIRPSIPDSTPVTYPYEVSLSNVMVLKGDYTQKPPSYFKGIKSVAEDNQNKIEISSNRPYLVVSKYTSMQNTDIATVEFENIYDVNVGDNLFLIGSTGLKYPCTILQISNNTLVLKFDKAYTIGISVSNKLYQTKQDKSEISLASPLKEKDYIDKNGVHRKSEQYVINQNSTTKITGTGTNTIRFRVDNILNFYGDSTHLNIIADKFVTNLSVYYDAKDEEGVCTAGSAPHIRILKSTLGILASDNDVQKLQKLKAWLQANPITIVYETATETIEPINESLILSAFKDGCFGVNAGAINPNVSLRYTTNQGERITAVEESNAILRNSYYNNLKTIIKLADRELKMRAIQVLSTETNTDLKNKINEILNIWK